MKPGLNLNGIIVCSLHFAEINLIISNLISDLDLKNVIMRPNLDGDLYFKPYTDCELTSK
jgi:hypothetical protein